VTARSVGAGAVLLLAIASVGSTTPTIPILSSDPSGDGAILQEAVNRYGAIGVPASCAAYTTVNQGGTVNNLACVLPDGTWHSANLVDAMTTDQLKVGLGQGAGDPTLFSADVTSQQIGPTYGTVTAAPSSSTPGIGVGGAVSAASGAALLGCSVASALESILTGGGATEITQTCNQVLLYRQYVGQIQQLAQMVTQVERATQQYQHGLYMARYLQNLDRYRSAGTPWMGTTATDTYGRNSGWLGAINSGLNTARAWENATLRVATYPGGFVSWGVDYQNKKHLDHSLIELQDGTGRGALDTLGNIRKNGVQNEATLALLERDVLSQNPDMNTVAAQMNKANALALTSSRVASDNTKLLVTSTELALLRMRQERDAAAYALQNDVALHTVGLDALTAQHADASASISGYRIP
jgi:hypothetical protein